MSPASDIFVGKDAFYVVFYTINSDPNSGSYVRPIKKTYQQEMYPFVKYVNYLIVCSFLLPTNLFQINIARTVHIINVIIPNSPAI
jgi:hypothetical protein